MPKTECGSRTTSRKRTGARTPVSCCEEAPGFTSRGPIELPSGTDRNGWPRWMTSTGASARGFAGTCRRRGSCRIRRDACGCCFDRGFGPSSRSRCGPREASGRSWPPITKAANGRSRSASPRAWAATKDRSTRSRAATASCSLRGRLTRSYGADRGSATTPRRTRSFSRNSPRNSVTSEWLPRSSGRVARSHRPCCRRSPARPSRSPPFATTPSTPAERPTRSIAVTCTGIPISRWTVRETDLCTTRSAT